jgi:hypothetical protein
MGSSVFPQPHKEKVGSTVKKFIAMMLLVAFVAVGMTSVTGCGEDKKPAPPAKDKATTPEKDKDKAK